MGRLARDATYLSLGREQIDVALSISSYLPLSGIAPRAIYTMRLEAAADSQRAAARHHRDGTLGAGLVL